MKKHNHIQEGIRFLVAAGIAVFICFGATSSRPQDTKQGQPGTEQREAKPDKKQQPTPANNGVKAAAKKNSRPKQITGAEIYSLHCARCHPERYPNERTSAQWKTIALHMRVRANLPAEDVRKVLKYLQENSGY